MAAGLLSEVTTELNVDGIDPLQTVRSLLADPAQSSTISVDADPPRRIRTTWLDSVDRRLTSAGMLLRHDEGGGEARLLAGGAGWQLQTPLGRTRWPRLAHDILPRDDQWQDVAAVLFPRALQGIAHTTGTVRSLRMLDGEGKVIARGSLEIVVPPAPARSLTRLSLTPLRGYAAEVESVVERLCGSGTIARVQASVEAEIVGNTAVSRPKRAITAADPASATLAAVLLDWLDILDETAPGVIADIDTDFLHDFRVAVRRARSLLKVAGEVLPESITGDAARRLKRLGDLTTPTRDLDVFLLAGESGNGVVEGLAPIVEPVFAELRRHRAQQFRRLRRGLRQRSYTDFVSRLQIDLEVVRSSTSRDDGPTAGELAAENIGSCYRKVRRRGRAITPTSPVEDLHDLRKRCKELRYLLDAFRPILDPVAYPPAIRGLKDLQECLGRLQDAHVQNQLIHETAADLMTRSETTAPTLLALGAATTGVAGREAAVRAEFAESWQRFERPQVRRTMRLLAKARRP